MTIQIWTMNSLKSDLNYRKVPVKQFFDQRTVKYDSDYQIVRLIQVPLKTTVLVKTLQYIQEEWNSVPQCKRFSYSGSHLTRMYYMCQSLFTWYFLKTAEYQVTDEATFSPEMSWMKWVICKCYHIFYMLHLSLNITYFVFIQKSLISSYRYPKHAISEI